MKFYLSKNHLLKIQPLGPDKSKVMHSAPSWLGDVLVYKAVFGGKVIPITKTQVEQNKCNKLKDKIAQFHTTYFPQDTKTRKWGIFLEIGISKSCTEAGTGQQGYIMLKGVGQNNCLYLLRKLTNGAAKVCLELARLERLTYEYGVDPITAIGGGGPKWPELYYHIPTTEVFVPEMEILDDKFSTCVDYNTEIPNQFDNSINSSIIWSCTVTVTIPDGALGKNWNTSSPPKLLTKSDQLNKRMLEEEILSDVTIVTATGALIRAHKSILATQSSVFCSMFTTDMTENRESKLEIPDMSENSVRAFLRYLYYQDESVGTGELEQVFEIYQAAHKYDVATLEFLIRDKILEKPDDDDWFELDSTLRLFTFLQKLSPADEDLQRKVVNVLKRLMKDVKDYEICEKLISKHPAAAVELCKLALSKGTDL